MLLKTGTYTGTGSSQNITGVGFQPDLVIVKIKHSSSYQAWFRTKDMPANTSVGMRADSGSGTGRITAFVSDGFTVTTENEVNQSGQTYVYACFKDDGDGAFTTFTYTGNGTNGRTLNIGLTPDFVMAKSFDGITGVYRYSSQSGTNSAVFYNGGQVSDGGFASIVTNGFTVSTGGSNYINRSTKDVYGFAFKNTTGAVNVGSYTGNNTDNRNITGVGFQPDFLWIKKDDSGLPRFKTIGGHGTATTDDADAFSDDGNYTDYIQQLQSDGFQLGANSDTNGSGRTHFWLALKNQPSGSDITTTKTQAGKTSIVESYYKFGYQPAGVSRATIRSTFASKVSAANSYLLTNTGMPGGMPAGAYRIKVPDQYTDGNGGNNHTFSEGIGYWMLIYAYMSDSTSGVYNSSAKAWADGLWIYYNYFKDANGLMNWRVDSTGTVTGTGGATDGDLDVALALILLHRIHGSAGAINYNSQANTLLTAISTYEFFPSNHPTYPNLHINGDQWNPTDDVLFMDYFSPAHYREFYRHTGDTVWLQRIKAGYDKLRYFYNTFSTGYVPDNAKRDGTVNTPFSYLGSYVYGYNAMRMPWRIATDYVWNGVESDVLAHDNLEKLATFQRTTYGSNVSSTWAEPTMDNSSHAGYINKAYISGWLAASLTDTANSAYAANAHTWLTTATEQSYFGMGLETLALLLATGDQTQKVSYDTTYANSRWQNGLAKLTATTTRTNTGKSRIQKTMRKRGSNYLDFVGGGRQATIADNSTFNTGDGKNWAISTWVRPPIAGTSFHSFVQKGALGADLGWVIQRNGLANQYTLRIDTSAGTNQTKTIAGDYFDDNWHHLVWSSQWTSGTTATIYLYLDGNFVASGPYNVGGGINNAANLYIGRAGGFIGAIDELIIYPSYLTATDVTNIFKGAPPAGSSAYYKFDQTGSTTSIVDYSGNGNNLTMTGFTFGSDGWKISGVLGLSRITKTVLSTITGIANLLNAGTTGTKTITGKARLTKTVPVTTTGKSRLTKTVLQTRTGIARLTKAVQVTRTGIARLTKSVAQTITGSARLTKTVLQTVTGKGFITGITQKTITGVANVLSSTVTRSRWNVFESYTPATPSNWIVDGPTKRVGQVNGAVSGLYSAKGFRFKLYRVGNPGPIELWTVLTDNVGSSSSTPQGQTGDVYLGTIDGNALTTDTAGEVVEWDFGYQGNGGLPYFFGNQFYTYLKAPNADGTNYVMLKVTNVGAYSYGRLYTSTDSGANYSGQSTFDAWFEVLDNRGNNEKGRAKIIGTYAKPLTGVTRLAKNVAQTLTGVARLLKTVTQTRTGQSRIQKTVQVTRTGVSRLAKNVQVTILGIAKVGNSVQRTQTGRANVRNNTLKTITGASRIVLTYQKVQTGVSRLVRAVGVTRTGVARITKSILQTQLGRAAVFTSATQKTQLGVARIRLVIQKAQLGRSNLVKQVNRTITAIANIVRRDMKDKPGVSSKRDKPTLVTWFFKEKGYNSSNRDKPKGR